MALKRRAADDEGFVIQFNHLEMLRIEKLLKLAANMSDNFLTSEENEWLSDALMLFAPELPIGEYPIGTSKHDVQH